MLLEVGFITMTKRDQLAKEKDQQIALYIEKMQHEIQLENAAAQERERQKKKKLNHY